MNAIAKVKATYSINGETFQIPSSDIMSWLTYDGKVDLDTEQVRQYVTDLGTKYNTSTNDTKFKSTKEEKLQSQLALTAGRSKQIARQKR